MTEFSTHKAAESYFRLFGEILNRLEVVDHLLRSEQILPPVLTREMCYLQFRKICEMLALGSVFLHGDLPSAKQLEGNWNAYEIMKRLFRLHPRFFPKSATIKPLVHNGQKHWQVITNYDQQALTHDDFTVLYAKCGDVLHRGRIKSLDFTGIAADIDLADVVNWQQKLVALANGHAVERNNQKGFYFLDAKIASGVPACAVVDIENGNATVSIIRGQFA